MEDDGAASASKSQQSELSTHESKEQRFNSSRKFFDPLLRRRTSGWSIETQFFDLINLYCDLGRATSFRHRLSTDSPANFWLRAILSTSLDTANPGRKKKYDKLRSYYTSYCDMVSRFLFTLPICFRS